MATKYVQSEQEQTTENLAQTLSSVYHTLKVIEYGADKNGDRSALNLSRESMQWILESLDKAGYEIIAGRLYTKS